MSKVHNFEEAVIFLRKAVKYSNIDGQKHIDPALVNAFDLDDYKKAMILVRHEVESGKITEEDLKQRIGLL